MINNLQVGEKIKTLRKEKKWSQDELAEKLEWKSRQTVSEWEKGHFTLPVDELIKMCNLFDCDIGYLMGEYETKKHIAADVQEVTGLSEETIKNLIKFKELTTGNKEDIWVYGQILDVINLLISHEFEDKLFECIAAYLWHKYENTRIIDKEDIGKLYTEYLDVNQLEHRKNVIRVREKNTELCYTHPIDILPNLFLSRIQEILIKHKLNEEKNTNNNHKIKDGENK
ncbi:MAG: helix-turn-helix domain-containing protein [Oscillospiraceae bacterium]|nr:helix-turn-helix domain-containing protein [Oscillospiraceae bacterium]